jgi:hypothetical protein
MIRGARIRLAASHPKTQGDDCTALIPSAALNWAAKAQAGNAICGDGTIASACQFSEVNACACSAACMTALVAIDVRTTGRLGDIAGSASIMLAVMPAPPLRLMPRCAYNAGSRSAVLT